MPVYYGDDSTVSTLPILFWCIGGYLLYKVITSQSAEQSVIKKNDIVIPDKKADAVAEATVKPNAAYAAALTAVQDAAPAVKQEVAEPVGKDSDML